MAKHLSLEDRNLIAQRLNEGCSFKAIAAELGRNCTSISREVRNHLNFKKVGSPGKSFNACKHRFSCKKFQLCRECSHKRFTSFCKNCKHCNSVCSEFEAEICQKLLAPPYVCNGCGYEYDPEIADPDNEIYPFTLFDALPEDWTCPECGEEKSNFVIV